MKSKRDKPSLTVRGEIIRGISKDYKNWKSSVHLLMGSSISKKDGYKLKRLALRDRFLSDPNLDFDALLNVAENDPEVDSMLAHMASILLYKLAETDPPPLKWFPKELAMHASVKLLDLVNVPPSRHRGTNPADYDSRDYFSITEVLKVCKEHKLKPTRNRASKADCGCSLVAEGMGLNERAVLDAWRMRKQFGFE